MPWYTYLCEKCGDKVQLKASLAYRAVMPLHRGEGGCGDGRLKRLQPATGPGEVRRAPRAPRPELANDGSAGTPARTPPARPGNDPREAAPAPASSGAPQAGVAWEDVVAALSSIVAESASGPGRVEALRRLLETLPAMSPKLGL
jgi:hypothetical protein